MKRAVHRKGQMNQVPDYADMEWTYSRQEKAIFRTNLARPLDYVHRAPDLHWTLGKDKWSRWPSVQWLVCRRLGAGLLFAAHVQLFEGACRPSSFAGSRTVFITEITATAQRAGLYVSPTTILVLRHKRSSSDGLTAASKTDGEPRP